MSTRHCHFKCVVLAVTALCNTSTLLVLLLQCQHDSVNTVSASYCSVIFVNENENENSEKRENNEFINEN